MTDLTESGRQPYREYPPAGKDTNRVPLLIDWAKNPVAYMSLKRMREWAFCRLADLFFVGDQWCTAERFGYVGVELAAYYQPDDMYFGVDFPPRPVLNEYKDVILNEQARLDRSDYAPTVRPMGESPGYRERNGAKIATRALRASLEADNWEHKKRLAAYHLPSYGGVYIESEWEVSMEDTVRVPVNDVTACPTCSTKYGPPPKPKPGMPPSEAPTACLKCITHDEQQAPDAATVASRAAQMEVPPDGVMDEAMMAALAEPMNVTLLGGPALKPYIPASDDLNAKDFYGQPLGEDVPRGNGRYTVHDHGSVFEENLGIGEDGTIELRDYSTVRVKSLDWIRARYARARTLKLRPDSAALLSQYHPISAGSYGESDDMVYRNHARVIRRVRWPWMEEIKDDLGGATYVLNRGKVVTVCGGLVLQDEDLMIDGPPDANGKVASFPRILMTYTPHDIGHGGQERTGSSLSRQLIDPQRCINMSALMDIDEQRNGQSRWLVSDAADLNYENAGEAGSKAVWRVPPDTENVAVHKPELVSRTSADMKYGQSAEYHRSYMARTGRATETETGVIDPNAPASAIQIAREESAEVRRPRVEALAKNYQKLFGHRLQLEQRYVKEQRVAWDKQDSGTEFQAWYTGADFAGQTDVTIDVEGAADTELLKQKKLDEAIAAGTVDMTNPANRRVIGKLKGLPSDLTQGEDLQEQNAEREYLDFAGDVDPGKEIMFGRPPVVDDGIDDHVIHEIRHTKDLMSDTWREIEVASGWDTILTIIGGWKERVLAQMAPPPVQMPTPIAGQPPMPPPPPGPPNIDMLKPTPQLAIVSVWVTMINEANAPMVGPDGRPVVGPDGMPAMSPVAGLIDPSNPLVLGVLSFRAHLAEHKLRNTLAVQAQAAVAPPAAA